MPFKKIKYADLNSRQKEDYNFQKIAATLADYGYSCMLPNDNLQGADFIANHIDGIASLKVHLRGRLTINKQYVGKNFYVAFRYEDCTYLYPHDELMSFIFKALPNTEKTKSWLMEGDYHWPNPMPKKLEQELAKYKL